jgi:hypothetical protein
LKLKTFGTGGADSAGMIAIPGTPGTDAAPRDDVAWPKRIPALTVRRSSEIVSVTNVLKYFASVNAR